MDYILRDAHVNLPIKDSLKQLIPLSIVCCAQRKAVKRATEAASKRKVGSGDSNPVLSWLYGFLKLNLSSNTVCWAAIKFLYLMGMFGGIW